MSITVNPRRNDYIGNGSVSQYDYDFKIYNKSHLSVITYDAVTDTRTVLVLDTDYTVSGVGSKDGGQITLIAGNLASGLLIGIFGRKPIEQQNDISNQGSFYPDEIEGSFDKDTMSLQELQEQINRCIKLDEMTDSGFDAKIPTNFAGNPGATLIQNPAGDGLKLGPTADEISGATASAAAAAASAIAAAASAVSAAASAALAASSNAIIPVDVTAGNVPQVLPSAALNDGKTFTYLNIAFASLNKIDVSTTGGDLINGQATDEIFAGEVRRYWSDGVSNWYVV